MTVCPAASIARRVLSIALWTGGKGLTTPSSTSIPKQSFSGRLIVRQGMGTMLGSDNHPSESTIALANSSRDLISADIGPLILRTASWPGRPDRAPYVENRPKDGFKAYKPVNEAGILTLPPISLPTPSGVPIISDVAQDSLPLKANKELSPPDDPPLLNRVL